jgi:hypothetical protein
MDLHGASEVVARGRSFLMTDKVDLSGSFQLLLRVATMLVKRS